MVKAELRAMKTREGGWQGKSNLQIIHLYSSNCRFLRGEGEEEGLASCVGSFGAPLRAVEVSLFRV